VTLETYDWHIESRLMQAISLGKTVDFNRLRSVYKKFLNYSWNGVLS